MKFKNSSPQVTGDFIKMLRLSHNMTQDDLGEKLFISRKAVSKWENGECYPKIDLMMSLCDLFGVNIEEILIGDFQNSDDTDENESIKFMTKLIRNRNFRIIAFFMAFISILSLLIFFFENYNSTKVYNVWYDDEYFHFMYGYIITTPHKDYFDFGKFYTDLNDIDKTTRFEFEVYKKNKDGTRETLLNYQSNALYYFENNYDSLAPIKIKNRLKHLYIKIKYTNIYDEEKEYILHLNVELAYQNNDVQNKDNKSEGFSDIFDTNNLFENKNNIYISKNYDINYFSTIDLSFLYKMNSKTIFEKFNKENIIYDNDYYNVDVNNNDITIQNSEVFMRILLNEQRLHLKMKKGLDQKIDEYVFVITSEKKIINDNLSFEYYSTIKKILYELYELYKL